MEDFIREQFKRNHALPMSKGLNTATYTLPLAIRERVAQAAKRHRYAVTEQGEQLTVKF